MAKLAHIRRSDLWFRYATQAISWTITDSNGDNVDMSGQDVRFQLLAYQGATSALLEKTTTGGGVTIATEVVTVSVATSDYGSIPAGVYWYELWDQDDDTLLATGSVVIHASNQPD